MEVYERICNFRTPESPHSLHFCCLICTAWVMNLILGYPLNGYTYWGRVLSNAPLQIKAFLFCSIWWTFTSSLSGMCFSDLFSMSCLMIACVTNLNHTKKLQDSSIFLFLQVVRLFDIFSGSRRLLSDLVFHCPVFMILGTFWILWTSVDSCV